MSESALGGKQRVLGRRSGLDGLQGLVPGGAQLGGAPLDALLELLVEALQLQVRLIELTLLLLGDGLGLLSRLPLPLDALLQTLDVVHPYGPDALRSRASSRGA